MVWTAVAEQRSLLCDLAESLVQIGHLLMKVKLLSIIVYTNKSGAKLTAHVSDKTESISCHRSCKLQLYGDSATC